MKNRIWVSENFIKYNGPKLTRRGNENMFVIAKIIPGKIIALILLRRSIANKVKQI